MTAAVPDSDLSAEQHLLVRLGAAVVLSNYEELRRLRSIAQPNRRWREVLLQATLFAGFPRVIDAFDSLEACGGLGTPEDAECVPQADDKTAGKALFSAIYGTGADAVQALLRGHHPQLAHWVEGHAYGRVLSRGGLQPMTRELVAVAMLTVSGLERQLASHARGAVRLGASSEQVFATLAAIADLTDAGKLASAREVVRTFAR